VCNFEDIEDFLPVSLFLLMRVPGIQKHEFTERVAPMLTEELPLDSPEAVTDVNRRVLQALAGPRFGND